MKTIKLKKAEFSFGTSIRKYYQTIGIIPTIYIQHDIQFEDTVTLEDIGEKRIGWTEYSISLELFVFYFKLQYNKLTKE